VAYDGLCPGLWNGGGEVSINGRGAYNFCIILTIMRDFILLLYCARPTYITFSSYRYYELRSALIGKKNNYFIIYSHDITTIVHHTMLSTWHGSPLTSTAEHHVWSSWMGHINKCFDVSTGNRNVEFYESSLVDTKTSLLLDYGLP